MSDETGSYRIIILATFVSLVDQFLYFEDLDSELRQLSFRFTCPLTVFYGAEKSGLAKGAIDTYEKIVIHVVGARIAECRDVTAWEIFPLRLPKLKQMAVVFIGPEVRYPYSRDTRIFRPMQVRQSQFAQRKFTK